MEKQLSLPMTVAALTLIAGALICEGFDVASASFAVIDIVREFGVAKEKLGPFLAASAVGMLFGSVLLGPWGDRIGRKPLVVGGVIGFGGFTLLSALSTSLWQLTLSRFVIGVCAGALLPNAVILAGELLKERARARASAGVTLGITFGASIAGVISAAILPHYGWRGLAVFGGVIPIAFSAVLWLALPESPIFGERARTGAKAKISPALLFRDGLAGMTLAMWLMIILLSMSLYLLSGWTPLLLRQSGFDTSQAALAGGIYYFGGLMGGALVVLLLGRSDWRMLAAFLGLAALSVLVVSRIHGSTTAIMISLGGAGMFMTASQAAFNGLGASAYPIHLRASGFGYALGVMRIGTIGGPLLGAALVGAGLKEAQSLYLIPVAPLIVAASLATWLSMRIPHVERAAPAG